MKEPKKPRAAKPNPKLPTLFNWFRSAGVIALVSGLGSIFIAWWFWTGVALVYFGFLLLMVDLWLEPDFRGKPRSRAVAALFIFLLITVFSWVMVFVDAPLPVRAMMTDGDYPNGTVIAGIAWRPEFTELNVDLENPTDKTYEDLNIVVRPTEAVAAIAQITSVPGVSIEDKYNFASNTLDVDSQSRTSKAVPLTLIATDAGYRVRCPRLTGHSVLKLVIALVDIKWNPHRRPGVPYEQLVRDPDYKQRIKLDDFSSYWKGYKDGDNFATRPTSSEWIKVDGEYTVLYHRRSISEKIGVGGRISIK
jgi:hypothetical protein